MKTMVVLNPISGSRNKDDFHEILEEFCRLNEIDFKIFMTTGDHDESKIIAMLDELIPDRVLAVGGDGTVTLCARCLAGRNIPLGIIPFGSANGMAMELDIGGEPEVLLHHQLTSENFKFLDLYSVNEKYTGLHIGDSGLNARIVEGFSRDAERGFLTYAKHFLREFSQSELINYTINVNGRVIRTQAYMVAFANARKYGTGVMLNRKGDLSDGKIEIVIARDLKIKTLLLAGMSAINEEIGREGITEIISCKYAVIETEYPVSAQIDGEPIGSLKKLKVKVIPGAVKIILPEN